MWQLDGRSRRSRRGARGSTCSVTTCSLANTLAPLHGWGGSVTEAFARYLVRDP